MTEGFAYVARVRSLLSALEESPTKVALIEAAALCADAVESGHLIHVFGSGHSHSAAEEAYHRAGGLASVNGILIDFLMPHMGSLAGPLERTVGIGGLIVSTEPIAPGDVVFIVSNSGINPVPVEVALESKKRGAHTVAITSLQHSASVRSRLPDGKKLSEVVDIVLDTHVPVGDAAVELEDGTRVGGVSSVISLTTIQVVLSECCRNLVARGITPPVFRSANLEDSAEWNAELTNSMKSRIPRFSR